MIVTASDFRFIVIEQLAALDMAPADILIEPAAKNTAAAICAAALALEARAPGALMLVAPSDHVIPDAARFRAEVWFRDRCLGAGLGPSRKAAEQAAYLAVVAGAVGLVLLIARFLRLREPHLADCVRRSEEP